jgi:glycosyltransferase involved in cell wall biosynthesis
MKIVIIGTAYPYRGGLASYNERLAREFLKEGHEVTIYTFTVQYPSFLFPGKTQYSNEKIFKGLNIVRCINSVNPLNWISVGNKIKKENPDLVIVKYWLPFMGACFGTILRRIKRNGTSKVITIVDNMIPHESRIGDHLLTKYFIKPVDAFVAMSEIVLSDIKSFDTKKIKIQSPQPLFDNFGEGISRDEAFQKLGLHQEYHYLLFFGLIRKYKGLDLLIEAFADERLRHLKLKLIIAGEYYSDKKIYTDLIKKHSLENHIIQVDKFIPNSEVKLYFSAADVVVQPYKSATQSGVTQIAYHFNKPMIVTNVGGLAELCPHEKVGYVVSPDPIEIADAIFLFFNKENEFISNIIKEKKKYSWDVLTKKILKTLEDLNNI